MAEVDGMPSFGAELKASKEASHPPRYPYFWLYGTLRLTSIRVILQDGFKPANIWVAHGISFLDDMQQYYRDRSLIEKEYSSKLSALAKKYLEKKARKTATLSVGDSPSMTPGSLESASLTTWNTQLLTLEKRAEEHDRFGNGLVTKVADPLKALAARLDDLRRRHADHAERLEKERDSSHADLRKVKTKYDAACQEVETRRKKSESAFDKAKAQSAYQQQIQEMSNVKNTYLIAINVTNKQKEMYYYEYVPELMDSLQELAELRTTRLNSFWTMAAEFEAGLLQQGYGMMHGLTQEISRNQPNLDSSMYMSHNRGTFQEPPDKPFEPSPVWHDEDTMVIDDTAKVFLRNMLNKSKSQLGELRREVDRKKREVEAAKREKIQQQRRSVEGVNGNGTSRGNDTTNGGNENDQADDVDALRKVLGLTEEFHQVERRRVIAEVETSTITSVVGDVTLGARNHNFKAQTFKIPTNCDLCGERIWGLSAKGFDCRDCGYICHNKCEMKVPAVCPGEQSKEERKRLKAERQEAANALLVPTGVPEHVAELPTMARSNTVTTMTSLSSGYANRRASAAMATTPTVTPPATEDDVAVVAAAEPRLSMSSAAETTAAAAAAASTTPTATSPRPTAPSTVSSNTVKKKRMMAPPPVAYVSELPGSPMEDRTQPCGEQRGKMLYGFEASGPGELTVPEGRDVMMLEPDEGSGWVKVRAGYKEGLVPSTYVEFGAPSPMPSPWPAPAVAQHDTGASGRPESTYSNSGSSIGTGSGIRKKGPAVAPKRGAKKLRYVTALYDYEAQNDMEHSMEVGERLVLIRDDPGDGWVEVEKGGAHKSVPASYVEKADG